MTRKLDYVIMDIVESAARSIKVQPLNLGATSSGGGTPPGGWIGYLPQTRVTYDPAELETLYTPTVSGSLLDNLNHIRYRINALEEGGVSGSGVIVVDDNTPATYDPTTHIHFSGAGVIVTDLGTGQVRVTITGGGDTLGVGEWDGSPFVSPVNAISFQGATVADVGGGEVLVTISGGAGTPLTVREVDGSPSVSSVDTVVFSGISVEDLGSGDALAYIPTQRQGVATNLTFYPVGDGNFLDASISYYGLYPEPQATARATSSGTLTAANESVAVSITAPGVPGTYNIGEGVYLFQIRAKRLSGTKNVKIKGRVYKRTSGGTETLLAETNETPNLTDSYANYTVSAATTTWTVMSPSDFIVVKYVATPYNTGTDPTAQIEFNNSSGYTRVELPSAIQSVPDIYTGQWILRPETWTRTGNHTFTIAGDYTTIYRKGTRVRYRDGGSDEYGAVLSSTYSSPNTTVTLITNTDYTMAAATITNKYISYKDRPYGFPNSFTFAPAFTNLTVGDGTLAAKFFPGVDSFIDFEVAFTFGSTSSITSAGVDLTPPAPSIDVGVRQPVGVCTFADTGVISYAGVLLSVSGTSFGTRALGAGATYTTQVAVSATVPFTWGNTDTISIRGRYQY